MAKTDASRTIAFQGVPGAYSDLACRGAYPDWSTLSCGAFEDAFAAVHEKRAALAMLPIENSVAGGRHYVGHREDHGHDIHAANLRAC